MDFWVRAAQLILSLSFLIVIHEFGHYLPAKWFNTRVEKFYLFFNPYFSVFKKKIGETEWGLGWIPLGGYVKIAGMVDESMDTEQLAQPAQPWEFRSKPAWQRLIIMLGGIIVNVVVGFLIYIMVIFVWGEEKVDHNKLQNGIAVHPYFEQFGFQSGDKVLSVNGEKADELNKLGMEIMIFGKTHFKVQHKDGKIQTINLPEDIGNKMWENNAEAAFSFRYFNEGIDSVIPKSAAERIGLKKGDKIVGINGNKFVFFDEITTSIYKNRGKKCELEIQSGDSIRSKEVKIAKDGKLGFYPKLLNVSTDTNAIYTQHYSLGESFGSGISKGYKSLYANLAQFKYVFSKKGANSIGGVGSIGKLFPPTWNWQAFWTLTAFLSMMLAIMNLLPIPALDGGHVMFLLYEIITGRTPGQKFMEYAQYVGFFLLLGLILYANGKDLIGAFTN
ncbi:RIP metalloprotease RseP [Fluviicola taffensis]|uniref:Zinc metalloprotease n=1 Tax=Fluviicola taffensis (strain DSM 16823 / NCIMB 13979 / RW262) TaxID=755732 RepID=F2IB79_FLUTR|nr:RIP metalloprotease RseP [Fluviicola taffensis]AEA43165.1 site-2 protease [Fluviicola taffensis DSM 16823]